MVMSREERREAAYEHGMALWGDEDMADALRDAVMGDTDDDMPDHSWWELLAENAQAIGQP